MELSQELVRTLREFARPAANESSFGLRFQWDHLVGPQDLLRRGLRAASETVGWDRAEECFANCWDYLNEACCLPRIREYYLVRCAVTQGKTEEVDFHACRLHRNACVLTATAAAAVNLRRLFSTGDGNPENLLRWLTEAAHLLGEPEEAAAGLISPQQGADASVFSMAVWLEDQLLRLGWNAQATVRWIRWWLGVTAKRAVRVPVAGCYAGQGFLGDLILEPLQSMRNHLVESPGNALRPIGSTIVSALEQASKRTRRSVCWDLQVRTRLRFAGMPLDGDSLGAAAAAGFELMTDFDARCLVLARLAGECRLAAVGFEWEKLQSARKAPDIQRAAVGPDTRLTIAEILGCAPLKIAKVWTLAEAVAFAAVPERVPPVRWL